MLNLNIQAKLNELRRRYVDEPEHRESIELQAKILKLALNAKPPRSENKVYNPGRDRDGDMVKSAEENLL